MPNRRHPPTDPTPASVGVGVGAHVAECHAAAPEAALPPTTVVEGQAEAWKIVHQALYGVARDLMVDETTPKMTGVERAVAVIRELARRANPLARVGGPSVVPSAPPTALTLEAFDEALVDYTNALRDEQSAYAIGHPRGCAASGTAQTTLRALFQSALTTPSPAMATTPPATPPAAAPYAGPPDCPACGFPLRHPTDDEQAERLAAPPVVPPIDPFDVDILRALCGEASICVADVLVADPTNADARDLERRLRLAWNGEDPVGLVSLEDAPLPDAPSVLPAPEAPSRPAGPVPATRRAPRV